MAYTGIVFAEESDKEHLESLGAELGPYNKLTESFDCKFKTLAELDSHWGRYVWSVFWEDDPESK